MADIAPDIEPREWSVRRIATTVILLILLVGGVVYSIYSFTRGSGPSNSNQAISNSSNGAISSKPKESGGSTNKSSASPSPAPSSSPVVGSASGSSQSSPTATPAAPNNSGASQLTNTGPGDTAFISFAVASIVGTIGHYGWRKFRAYRV